MAFGEQVGRIFYALDLDSSRFRAGLTVASEESSGFARGLKGLSKVAIDSFAIAGAAAVGFGALSIKAYADSEKVGAQLNQVLITTGKVSQISKDQVEQLAMSMERYSGKSHDAIEQGQTLLLQFAQVTKQNLPEFTKAMLDLSQRMGVDTVTAAKQLGIALDDPTTGMARLRRSGIDFTAAQKEAIKAMQKSGDLAGADALLMQGLQEKVGGAAGAYRHTLAGSIESARNSLKDFEITVGATISKALEPLAEKAANALASIDWQRVVDNTTTSLVNFWHTVDTVYQKVAAVADQVWNFLKPSLEELVKVVSTQLLPQLERLWKTLEPGLTATLKVLAQLYGGLVVEALKLFIQYTIIADTVLADLLRGISNVIQWEKDFANDTVKAGKTVAEAFTTTKNTIVITWQAIPDFFEGIWNSITGTIRRAFNDIENAVKPWIDNFPKKLDEALDHANRSLGNYIKTTVEGWKNLADTTAKTIGDWATNIATGVASAVAAAYTAEYNFLAALPGQISTFLQQAIDAVIGWGVELALNAGPAASKAVDAIVNYFQNLPENIKKTLVNVYNNIVDFFTSLPGLIEGTVSDSGKKVADKHIDGMTSALKSRDTIQRIGNAIIEVMGLAVVAAGVYLVNSGVILAGKLKDGFVNGWNSELGFIGSVIRRVVDTVNSFFDEMYNSGLRLIQSFGRGIADGVKWAVDAAKSVLSSVRKLLPFSDAKEGPLSDLTLSGRRFSETFAKGISLGAGSISDAANGALGFAMPGMSSSLNMVGGGGDNSSHLTNNIGTVNISKEVDGEALLAKLTRQDQLVSLGLSG